MIRFVSALLAATATSASITIAVYAFTRRLRWQAHRERGAPTEPYDALSWLIWFSATLGILAAIILVCTLWWLSDIRLSLRNPTAVATLYTIATSLSVLALGILLIGITLIKRKENLTRCSLRTLRR